jgi:hypothetical protein
VPFALRANQFLLKWTADGRGVWLRTVDDARLRISRRDLADGHETPLTELHPQSLTGFTGWSAVQITPDGRTLIVGESTALSQLYLVEGVR